MEYQELLTERDRLISQAASIEALAEAKHKAERKGNIEKWVDYHFESSSGLTPEFVEFSSAIRRELKKIDGFDLVSFSRGSFYFSAFLKSKKTEKLVYLSSSDVRHFKNGWWNDLLIRTAKHDKDYSGGSNCSCRFENIREAAISLTSE